MPMKILGLETAVQWPVNLRDFENIDVCGNYRFTGYADGRAYQKFLEKKYMGAMPRLEEVQHDFRALLADNPSLKSERIDYDNAQQMRWIMFGAASAFCPRDIHWFSIDKMSAPRSFSQVPGYAGLHPALGDNIKHDIQWAPHPITLISIYDQAKAQGKITNPQVDKYAEELRASSYVTQPEPSLVFRKGQPAAEYVSKRRDGTLPEPPGMNRNPQN